MKTKGGVFRKFVGIILPTTVIVFVILIALFEWQNFQKSKLTLQTKLDDLTTTFSLLLAESIAKNDKNALSFFITTLISDSDIDAVLIETSQGEVLEKFGAISTSSALFTKSIGVNYSDESGYRSVGKLTIAVTDNRIMDDFKSRLYYEIFLLFGLITAVYFSAKFAYRNSVGKPLLAITDSIHIFDTKAQHTDIEKYANDELGQVIDAYNIMQSKRIAVEKQLLEHTNSLDSLIDERTQELLEEIVHHKETTKENEFLQEKLNHSEKMDAIGAISGGISHDFNNILGIITGYAELINKASASNKDLTKYSNHILKASNRGAELTKKLLTFSSDKAESAETIAINNEIVDMKNMLERALTPSISVNLNLSNSLWSVHLNRGDFHDAILNMSINSMHAMPDGGELTIMTENINLSELDIKTLNLNVGEHIKLVITDNGVGMTAEDKRKAFDPFYTTKGEVGTGLGLSQVYGFVKQSKGSITLYSEINAGTSITILLPRDISEDVALNNPIDTDSLILSGNEVILVVDDEPALLELTADILTLNGYKVLAASNANQALEFLKEETVDLVVSDVIMPEINGHQLVNLILEKNPKIKIQLVSGFLDIENTKDTNSALIANVLHKPFSSNQLLSCVRTRLNT